MVWKQISREKLEITKKYFSSQDYLMQCYAMALEVILTSLGPDWWTNNCLPDSNSHFFKTDDNTETGRYEHQDRIIYLGHMLYALKDCKQFEIFIDKLKSRDTESVFFELWVAEMLLDSGMELIFVDEIGVKGKDYDLIAIKDNSQIYVEAKSRRRGEILNPGTLKNVLNDARKQLPTGGPGIICVWIPIEWTQHTDAERLIDPVIQSFFRNTKRVNTVIMLWETWTNLPKGKAKANLIRQYNNPNTRVIINEGELVKPYNDNIELMSHAFTPSFW